MNDFEYLNTYFNILDLDEAAYMRDLLSSYQYKEEFCAWLEKRAIHLSYLKSISRDQYNMLSKKMTALDVECMLHIPFTQEIYSLYEENKHKTHIVYIPGFKHDINIQFHKNVENYCFYKIEASFKKEDLSFFDPFSAFIVAMNQADLWPGILIIKEDKTVFTPIKNQEDVELLYKNIEENRDLFEIYDSYCNDSYFIQLSDLHLGRDKHQKGLVQLKSSLDNMIHALNSKNQLHFLITGDLMDSPNRKNMYLANDFMNELKKKYKADVTFILGNHDVIVHGFNFARMQKSKVIAYLLGENIKVLEKEKIILIKMDTTSEGNLARGKVGKRQLEEIDDELSAIEHIENYRIILLLHHHVYPITKAQFIKTKWHEKTFINKILETSKVLVDADELIQWINEKKIKYIFHGHKHLPFFREKDGSYYVSAGSSTGGLKESKSRYISYNVMKYSLQSQCMKTCLIFYDDKSKNERQRVEIYLYEEK